MKFRSSLFVFGILLTFSGVALGQTGYTITGAMSNFDCGNHCDDPCDEFEVEIEDCRPEDVVHCYHNSNYGAPTVTLSPSGTSTIIDYRNPHHPTAVGAIEHFGITLQQFTPYNTIRVRWMRNGQTATVNGQIPLPGGGSAPATQPIMPSISAEMDFGLLGGDGIGCSVTNNDPQLWIWIKRRAQVTQGVVSLEQLMPNDPVVTTTVPIDVSPILIAPGQTVTVVNDLIEVEDNESVVFAAEFFQDLGIAGPFNNTHAMGPSLGNVMTATIASPGTGCEYSSPVIIEQPLNVTADEGHSADLRVNADGNDLPLTFQWLKEGVPLVNGGNFHGVTTDELSIDEVNAESEGFYAVRISNTCGNTVSQSALVFITGHNEAPPRPCDPVAVTSLTTQSICSLGFSSFAVNTIGTDPKTYQWQIETEPGTWTALTDIGIVLPCGGEAYATTPNEQTTDILLFPCEGVDTYQINCAVANECGNTTSASTALQVYSGIAGDLTGDFEVNGDDIQAFADVYLSGSQGGPAFCAADLTQEGIVDNADVQLFVDTLLAW